MRFLKRDLTRFSLTRAVAAQSGWEIANTYENPPLFAFDGHIQPISEKENAAEYGLDPRYAYAVYANHADFRETDRIAAAGRVYEIKLVRRWASYCRLLVTEVMGNG